MRFFHKIILLLGWHPRSATSFVAVTILAVMTLFFATTVSAQVDAYIEIANDPLIAHQDQDTRIILNFGNRGNSLIEAVGIQCFVSGFANSITAFEKGPFSYTRISSARTYIEFGNDFFTGTYPDNVDISPGQNYEVAFNIHVTDIEGATGLIECFLNQFRSGSFLLITQITATVRVMPLVLNEVKRIIVPISDPDVPCSSGLAFDGRSLYYNRCDDRNIYKIDPKSGALQRTIDTGIAEFPNAMAYDSTRNGLWISAQYCIEGIKGMPIYFWDLNDDTFTHVFTIPMFFTNPQTGLAFGCFVNGLAFTPRRNLTDPSDDELWISTDIRPNVGVFRTDGTFLQGYDARLIDPSLAETNGLAIGGRYLYLTNSAGDVFKADRTFNPLKFIEKYALGSPRKQDMECDTATFAPKEVLWVRHLSQGGQFPDVITAHEVKPGCTKDNAFIVINDNKPILSYPDQETQIRVRFGNQSGRSIETVVLQCFITGISGRVTTVDAGPFTFARAATPTYIEFGADLTGPNNVFDEINIAPGQSYDVGFNFLGTSPAGSTGNIRCALGDYDPVRVGVDRIKEQTTSIEVRPAPDSTVEVRIDIRPFLPVNFINLNSLAPVPAAILSSQIFDARMVNPDTVTLAGAPAVAPRPNWPKFTIRDVNWDGLKDLILYFNVQDMTLTQQSRRAVLEGQTYAGQLLQGADQIVLIPRLAPRLRAPLDGDILSSNTPTLKWWPVSLKTCYHIQIDNQADFSSPEQQATVVIAAQYKVKPLANGLYFWRVQVGGDCARVTAGPWSEVWSFTIDPSAAPFHVDQQNTTFNFSWNVDALKPVGQEFRPTFYGLDVVELLIDDASCSQTGQQRGGSVRVQIRKRTITGTILGTSEVSTFENCFFDTLRFNFPSVVSLIPGQVYVIEVVYVADDPAATFGNNTGSVYSRGAMLLEGLVQADKDVWFREGLANFVPNHPNECKHGGWRNLVRSNGLPFKRQGDCIQFVNTGR